MFIPISTECVMAVVLAICIALTRQQQSVGPKNRKARNQLLQLPLQIDSKTNAIT